MAEYSKGNYMMDGQSHGQAVPTQPSGHQTYKPYQDIMSGMNYMIGNQQFLNGQMKAMNFRIDESLKEVKRAHKKLLERKITVTSDGQIQLLGTYSDGSQKADLLICNAAGEIQVVQLSFADDKYIFFAIIFKNCDITVLGEIVKLNPQRLYEAFIQVGIVFNPQISTSVIKKAIYGKFAPEIENCPNVVKKSGFAGWEDGRFCSDLDVGYLRKYKRKLNLPILKKHFVREDANLARVGDYKKFLRRLRDPEIRVLFALLPFAAIMHSILQQKQLTIPFVLNLILMTTDLTANDLAEYFQIFNRDEIKAFSVDDSDKNILSAVQDSKDEVVVFAGLEEKDQTNNKNNKITTELHMLAKNALGRSGVGYREHTFMSLLVLCSNQVISLKGVKNLFVGQDFFDLTDSNAFWGRSVDAVLSLFVFYAEGHMPELTRLMDADYQASTREERYWKIILAITEEFWRSVNYSFVDILNLAPDFQYDFLWEEGEYDMENGVELLVSAVRKAMPSIAAVPKNAKIDNDNISETNMIYDEMDIWILPELLDRILEHQGMKKQKNHLLLQCKEAGMLKTGQFGGYTTRLQRNNERKEYYRFERSRFSNIGQVELINLAKGEGGSSNAERSGR